MLDAFEQHVDAATGRLAVFQTAVMVMREALFIGVPARVLSAGTLIPVLSLSITALFFASVLALLQSRSVASGWTAKSFSAAGKSRAAQSKSFVIRNRKE